MSIIKSFEEYHRELKESLSVNEEVSYDVAKKLLDDLYKQDQKVRDSNYSMVEIKKLDAIERQIVKAGLSPKMGSAWRKEVTPKKLHKQYKDYGYSWLGESVNEGISDEAVYIHQITGSGQAGAQDFIDDNNIDAKKLADYVKHNRNTAEIYNVRDIIAGTGVGANKSFVKRFIKQFLNESVGSDLIDDYKMYGKPLQHSKTTTNRRGETVVHAYDSKFNKHEIVFDKNGKELSREIIEVVDMNESKYSTAIALKWIDAVASNKAKQSPAVLNDIASNLDDDTLDSTIAYATNKVNAAFANAIANAYVKQHKDSIKESKNMKNIPTFEAFVNESSRTKAKLVTASVGKHKNGHNVISVHYWHEERHAKDYMGIRKEKDDLVKVQMDPKEAENKIKELQKEYNVKDKDVFKADLY